MHYLTIFLCVGAASSMLLMIAERLNQIGRRLDDIDESIDERK